MKDKKKRSKRLLQPVSSYKNSRNFRLVAFLVIFALLGATYLIVTRAATPTASLEPENSAISGAASKVTDATVSGGSYIQFGSGSGVPAQCLKGGNYLWSNLETCGWPGPSNTGPDLSQCPGGALTNNSGSNTRVITISTPNTVINCQNISGGLLITAPNVTIKNSVVSYNGGGTSGHGVIEIAEGGSATIDHVETNGNNRTHACVFNIGTKSSSLAYSMVVKNLDCHNVNDGIFSWWWPSNSNPNTGSDFIIEDSYLHDFTQGAANGHIDGYQTEGAQNGLIKHNTFRMQRTANDVNVQGGGMTSAIALWNDYNQSSPTGKVTKNIIVEDNLFTGGGFTIYAQDLSPGEGANGANGGNSLVDVHFTNNKFSNYFNPCVGEYGIWFYRSAWPPYYGGPTDGWNQGGSTRSGNIILENSFNLDSGNPSGCV